MHLSAAAAIPTLEAARADGVRVSVETCPHYLTFADTEVPDGATQFKCCPPIRDAANREALWDGLRSGAIDVVVSDHSPCTPELKRLDAGDFGAAWGGIASLQLGLRAVWTGARERGVPLTDVVRWMATGTADLVGLTSAGGSSSARPPTWSRSLRRTLPWWTRAPWPIDTRSRPMTGARSPARSGRSGSAGGEVDESPRGKTADPWLIICPTSPPATSAAA